MFQWIFIDKSFTNRHEKEKKNDESMNKNDTKFDWLEEIIDNEKKKINFDQIQKTVNENANKYANAENADTIDEKKNDIKIRTINKTKTNEKNITTETMKK